MYSIRAGKASLILMATASALDAGCARHRPPELTPGPPAVRAAGVPCQHCSTLPMTPGVTDAVAARVTELKARGGGCLAYGEVLEASLASGRITLRPYMWRVGSDLASAEGRPGGEMILALEIDSLNVGVRTIDDVLRSLEHEAAHIAFGIPSGDRTTEADVDQHVNRCQPTSAARSARK
ncbi:MAG TPA: hypothetical protein VHE78_08275 [Gemmatimonadaceae bacterium]|nr:hypothetical protein [Gemmatimonadaceae bacterium]